jgi:AcrR family transcriptional regulator
MEGRFVDRARKGRVEAILVATMTLLAEGGYDRFRVDEVARRVGVAKGTIYLDFPSKEGLAEAAVKDAGVRLVAKVSEATAKITDPAERLPAAVQTAARTLVEQPQLAIAVECRPLFGAFQGPKQPCDACKKVLEKMVEEARSARSLLSAEDEITAEALLGLLSRPAWRALAAEAGVEEALRRAGINELVAAPSR